MTPLKTLSLSACLLALLAFAHPTAFTGTIKAGKPEDLALAVIKALRNNDQKAFTDLAITKEDMIGLLNEGNFKRTDKADMASRMDEVISRNKENLAEAFFMTVEEGRASGIDWAHAIYDKCKAESRKKDGVETCNIEISFFSARQKGVVSLQDAFKTKDGWKLGGKMTYGTLENARKVFEGEKKLMEARARAVADSISMALEKALNETLADTLKK